MTASMSLTTAKKQLFPSHMFKTSSFFFFYLLFFNSLYSQTGYDEIHDFDKFKQGWALVELNKKYGFIDTKGLEVVAPIYDNVYKYQADMVD